MPDYRPTTIEVELPHFDAVDITNHERAAMVEPLLRAFTQTYYHRDYDPSGPLLDYMVIDFLADVMHWCRLWPVLVSESEEQHVDFDDLVAAGRVHFDAEVAEETPEHQQLACTACGRVGTWEDLCYHGEACPDDECGGTMIEYEERNNDAPL